MGYYDHQHGPGEVGKVDPEYPKNRDVEAKESGEGRRGAAMMRGLIENKKAGMVYCDDGKR